MRRLRKLVSLANVIRSRARRKGQIATFLLLIIVAILIFAMATANLGEVSATAVTVSNATDATALFLGSQLGSTSNVLCKNLSQEDDDAGVVEECDTGQAGLEDCKRTGILGIVLAAVTVAVVAIWFQAALPAVVGWVTPGAVGTGLGVTIAGGAMIGAMAGAVGGGIAQGSWTGAALGAIQGATIGAAIAGGMAALGGPFQPTLGSVQYTGAMTLPGATTPAIGSLTATVSPAMPSVVGVSTATGLMGGARSYYGLRGGVHAAAVEVRGISKFLNGLADYERMREQTLLQALSQVVDDPNRTAGPGNPDGACYFLPDGTPTAVNGDPFDADGDGDKTESISCLEYWLSVRVNTLATSQLLLTPLITDFMEGPADFVPDGNDAGQSLKARLQFALGALGYLERNEVECACQGAGGTVRSEGRTVSLFRILADKGYNPPMFQPGPDQDAVRAFYQDPCDPTCQAPPAGWDSIDAMRSNYEEFIQFAAALVYNPIIHGPRGFSTPQEWYRNLARSVDVWLPKLYDPASTTDAYDRLGFIAGEYTGWFLWTRGTLVPSLPQCKLSFGDHPEMTYTQPQPGPLCANFDPVLNPDTGANDKDGDPIYPCTYTNDASSPPTAGGIYLANPDFNPSFAGNFPSPVCKIDLPHRERLVTTLGTMRTFVNDLDDWILARHGEHFDNPACEDDDDQLVTDTGDMTLVSIDEVGAPKWDGATLPSELVYTFTYEYECNTCSGGSCPGPQYTQQQQNTKRHALPEATDIEVPMQDSVQSFLDVVRALETWLRSLRLDAERRRFSTIDPDLENEMDKAVGDFLFITVGNPYGFSEEEGWGGTEAIPFFQLNIEGFYQAVQNRIATALPKAENGRLPNSDQIIKDPIRGEHEVDGIYEWRDSQGLHKVEVEIGPFIKPETDEEDRGIPWLAGKKCTVLKNYCENSPGCPSRAGRAWVRITRTDPVGQEGQHTRFWRWNPFAGTIKRTARAYYDRRAVGLCGTGEAVCR